MGTFYFDDDTTKRLEQLAAQSGAAGVEAYVRQCIAAMNTSDDERSTSSFDDELEPLLVDDSALPADFSRADIYIEHN